MTRRLGFFALPEWQMQHRHSPAEILDRRWAKAEVMTSACNFKLRQTTHAGCDQQGGVENVQYATNHKRNSFMVGCVLYVFNAPLISPSQGMSVNTRVHKNKSMQRHTLGSGTAEFQVTWPPKLREGTYLVKNVRARFEYRKTIAAHEKQVIMQEKAQPCASLWRKTPRPKRVRFLAIDAPIVDYVCLPLYHLTFLGSYQPLCEFSWRKKKEKAR